MDVAAIAERRMAIICGDAPLTFSRVLKKGKIGENCLDFVPSLQPFLGENRVFQHPARGHHYYKREAKLPDTNQPPSTQVNSNFKIKVSKNGPYLVSGGIPLIQQVITFDPEGYSLGYREVKQYPLQMNYFLCRCGQSRTMPFCDGMHTNVGFDSTETAGRKPYLELAGRIFGPTLALLDVEELCASSRF